MTVIPIMTVRSFKVFLSIGALIGLLLLFMFLPEIGCLIILILMGCWLFS